MNYGNEFKIKRVLGLEDDEEISKEQLFNMLFDYMKKFHPDKTSEDFKDIYHEKFVEANGLLQDLKRDLKHEAKMISDSSELILYTEKLEKNREKFDIIDLENKLVEANIKIEKLQDERKNKINEKVMNAENSIMNKKNSLVGNISKKGKDNLIFGSFLSLSTVLIMVKQIDVVKSYLSVENPFLYNAIDYMILGVVLIVTINYFVRQFMKYSINIFLAELETTKYKHEFIDSFESNEFSEKDVVNFLDLKLNQFKILKYLSNAVVYRNNGLLIDLGKDKLISYLLKYDVISYSSTDKGIHNFKLINRSSWDNEYAIDEMNSIFSL